MPGVCIGIDLGGTYIKLGALDDRRKLLGPIQAPTPPAGGPAVLDAMAAGAETLIDKLGLERADIVGVGIGSPGPLSRSKGVVYAAPNLPGFENLPVRDEMHRRLNLPVVLENDANAAAFGEYLLGAGRGAGSMVMLTLGTGVGGGVVLDGRLWHGACDFAGEIGHVIVRPDGHACGCGQRGCLEQYASATFLARRAEEALDAGRHSMLAQTRRENGAITAVDVNTARKAGDDLAAEVWDAAALHLAIGCVTITRMLDVERIVLAGGLSKAGDDLLTPVRDHFVRLHWRLTEPTVEITLATLGNDAGVVGCAGVAAEAFGQ